MTVSALFPDKLLREGKFFQCVGGLAQRRTTGTPESDLGSDVGSDPSLAVGSRMSLRRMAVLTVLIS